MAKSNEQKFLSDIRQATKKSLKKQISNFKKEINKYFRKQLKAYLNEIKNLDLNIEDNKKTKREKIEKIDIDIPEAEKQLRKVWEWFLKTLAIKWMADLLTKADIWLSFWIDDLYAVEFAKERAWKMITKVNNTTKKIVNWIINTWLNTKEDFTTIAKNIRTKFVGFSKFRSELIASNELKSAYEEWKQAQSKDFEKRSWNTMYKKWITQWDSRVTDECRSDAWAWWIPINEDFPTGHERPPRFPWCRCSLQHISKNVLNIEWIKPLK